MDEKIDSSWQNQKSSSGISSQTGNFSDPDKNKITEPVDPFDEGKEKYKNLLKPVSANPLPKIQENPTTEQPPGQSVPTPPEINRVQEPIVTSEPSLIPPVAAPVPLVTKPQIDIQKEQPFRQPPKTEIIKSTKNIESASTPFVNIVIRFLLIFVGIGVFVYLFLNLPAYYSKAAFYINQKLGKTTTSQDVLSKPLKTIQQGAAKSSGSEGDIFLPFVQQAIETPVNFTQQAQDEIKQVKSGTGINLADIADNTLIIPKTGVKAPIIWNSPPDENVMLENLQKGVVHYSGTALPGTGKGPIFITGHSSYYWWDKGGYKTIFVNLDQLENGDEIGVGYGNKIYIYKVFEKVVVKPEQVDVLDYVNEPVLALMTCVPIGTNNKRLIVRAKEEQITQANTTNNQQPAQTTQPQSTTQVQQSNPTVIQSPGNIWSLYILPWF